MSKTITALTTQTRRKNRVNVVLDTEYAFSVSREIADRLYEGQELSDREIEDLKQRDEWSRAYSDALRYLAIRPRSVAEMQQYLWKRGIAEDSAVSIVKKLTDEGFLDDEQFARVWVADRLQLRPRGVYALRYELRQKGIAGPVIDDVLGDVDDSAVAWMAASSVLSRWIGLESRTLKKRLMGYLIRRGFTYEVARRTAHGVLDELNRECESGKADTLDQE
jgi:regulatory protein